MPPFDREYQPPQQTPQEGVAAIANLWMAMAEKASDIAASKRRMYLAYVAEGFTESQALELCKSFS